MTVLDTFYILFKNNSADVVKANKDIEKSSKETAGSLKDANDQAEKLGDSFVKLVEGGAQAAAAVLSFGAIKAGVLDAAAFNSNLEVQGKLLGQNVTDLKAWGAAATAAGGSAQGLMSAVQTAFGAASAAGIKLPAADVLMRRYHDLVKGASPERQGLLFDQLGVSDAGLRSILAGSDADFEKAISEGRKNAEVTQEGAKAARDFEAAWSKAASSLDTLFTRIGSDVLPPVTTLVDKFTEFTDSMKNNKIAMYEFFGGMIALSITAAGAVGKLAASLVGLGGATGALAGLSSRLGIAGAVTGGLPLIAEGSYSAGEWIGHKVNKWLGRGDANGVIAPRSNAQAAVAFWVSQGYTREQAAGIAANEQRESGGSASARGDGGSAVGLYQWHPDRAAKILAATGIDVTTADADSQRRAAAWELQNSGLGDRLKNTSGADASAALFSKGFERPANGAEEAILRGQMALGIASNTPFGSPAGAGDSTRTSNIKIDAINVHTQATDAQGISGAIGDELSSHLRTTVSNFDDGVAY